MSARVARRCARAAAWIVGAPAAAWCLGALVYAPLPWWLRPLLAAGWIALLTVALRRRGPRLAALTAGVGLGIVAAHLLLVTPRLDRAWSPDQARLPRVERAGDRVLVHDVRCCRYRSTTDYDVAWEDRTYDLATTTDAWLGLESLAPPAAHVFLSFGFADGRRLCVSPEIRREAGERFEPLPGMFRRFELMYVLADERDVVGLRVVHRRDEVRLYPLRLDRAQARALLEDVLARVEALATRPEFYHTFANSCSVNLARHVDRCWPGFLPWRLPVFLPATADRLAYDLGALADEGDFAGIRARRLVDPAVAAATIDGAGFSAAIRAAP